MQHKSLWTNRQVRDSASILTRIPDRSSWTALVILLVQYPALLACSWLGDVALAAVVWSEEGAGTETGPFVALETWTTGDSAGTAVGGIGEEADAADVGAEVWASGILHA